MRIGLADVKKRISRADGELVVTPHLLGPRQLTREIEALVALYEAHLGKEQATFPPDRAAELVGDYRLARCLSICMTGWYDWEPIAWPGTASADEAAALASARIADPSQLRLALYDSVNAAAGGYLATLQREDALNAFAAGLGIARSTLDDLLWLDAEERAILTRTAEAPPSPRELALRYNQQVFEALLTSASQVDLTIPGAGTAHDPPQGTVVKRICFLARTFGVQYDVSFAPGDDSSDASEESRPSFDLRRVAESKTPYSVAGAARTREAPAMPYRDRDIVATLFGPLEVTGSPQQYGERLARLCRALLGYRRAEPSSEALMPSGFSGSARIYIHGKPMRLRLDERLLSHLSRDSAVVNIGRERDVPSFDSGVESEFFTEFDALERAGESRGWHLEREPEPVIVGSAILVPDFTLTRGTKRIYLEIAGYWRPEYRERKVRKLLAVADVIDLLVAAPRSAHDAFAPLQTTLPVLWYTASPRASALLDLLDVAYDDFTVRLASLDFVRIEREVRDRGRIPPVEGMALLRCYSRGELSRVLDVWSARGPSQAEERPRWVEDVGLCAAAWLDDMLGLVRRQVACAPNGRVKLSDLAAALEMSSSLTEQGVEALVHLAGLRVTRPTLFMAEVLAPGQEPDAAEDATASYDSAATSAAPRERQPRRQRQRKTTQNAPIAQPLFPAD